MIYFERHLGRETTFVKHKVIILFAVKLLKYSMYVDHIFLDYFFERVHFCQMKLSQINEQFTKTKHVKILRNHTEKKKKREKSKGISNRGNLMPPLTTSFIEFFTLNN